MKPVKGYNNAQASGEFERLEAGGYVIKITDIKDETSKEYLRIVYDIAEGPEAGRYAKETSENEYRHSFVRSYKETALGMFKAFIQAVDETNGTKFGESIEKGFDEKMLVGKLCGVVFGYEEYEANDGSIKERLRVAMVCSADRIRKGDYKVPALKKLDASKRTTPAAPVPGFTPLGDADLPF